MADTGYRTGGLHTGEALPPGSTGHTGGLHTGGVANAPAPVHHSTAPVAETRDHHHDDVGVVATKQKGGKAGKVVNGMARTILAILQLLTFLAFMVALGGLSALQHRANNLNLSTTQRAAYTENFQSGGQVPYPGSASDQFAFQWYILAVEIVVTLLILAMICTPIRFLERLKPFAMCLLTYAFLLTTLQIQSLLFYKRNPISNALYGKGRIRWTLAGAIAGAALNGLSLLFLSLLREPRHDHAVVAGGRGKRVGHDADYDSGYGHTGPAAV
jgi:hypothetical protein